MAGSTTKSIPSKGGKRVEVDANVMKRAKDGSAFTRCEECNKDVPVVLIDMHDCSIESRIKMKLEAHVIEKATEVKKPAEKKRKSVSSESKGKKNKSGKKVKDPNAPKRPRTAFFVFLDDFRKSFKEENPNGNDVKLVAKEGGAKWKSMTDDEKKPYIDRAQELKEDYEKTKETFKEEEKQEEQEEEVQEEQGDAGSEQEE